jgi:hypothetical protein
MKQATPPPARSTCRQRGQEATAAQVMPRPAFRSPSLAHGRRVSRRAAPARAYYYRSGPAQSARFGGQEHSGRQGQLIPVHLLAESGGQGVVSVGQSETMTGRAFRDSQLLGCFGNRCRSTSMLVDLALATGNSLCLQQPLEAAAPPQGVHLPAGRVQCPCWCDRSRRCDSIASINSGATLRAR